MTGRSRGLTEADRDAWAAYARQLTPLPGRPVPPPPTTPAVLPPRPSLPAGRPVTAPPQPLAIGESGGGLDAASWQRLRSGKLAPERKLDLHGMTTQRAFHALLAFLRGAHADRVRCVEVVTGRGSGEGGTIRREFPLWLNLPDVRPLVLGAAHPHPANPGAVRLLLRRVRRG